MRGASGHKDAFAKQRTVIDIGKIGLRGKRRRAWHGGRGTARSKLRIEGHAQHAANLFGNGGRFGQAARAEFAARHCPFIRVHDVHAIGAQLRQVALRRGMVPHADIHRRNRQNRFVRREQNCCRQIISDASGHLGKDIGRGGTNHHKVGLTAQLNMPDFTFFLKVEHVAIYLVFGHDTHRKRRDKFGRTFRHHRAHGNALTL